MDIEPVHIEAGESAAPLEPVPPIHNRFLFVDIAALRAKQLRRGARPRLEEAAPEAAVVHRSDVPHKAERVAMEEVRRGLIQYYVQPAKNRNDEAAS